MDCTLYTLRATQLSQARPGWWGVVYRHRKSNVLYGANIAQQIWAPLLTRFFVCTITLFCRFMTINPLQIHTVYPKKYAHGFVVLCFIVVMQSFIMNSHEVFIHIHQGCFAGTGAIVRSPQCQWSKPDGYGKISQCITTTKHSTAKTVCIFLGIYCMRTLMYIIGNLSEDASPIQGEQSTIYAAQFIFGWWYQHIFIGVCGCIIFFFVSLGYQTNWPLSSSKNMFWIWFYSSHYSRTYVPQLCNATGEI